MALPTDLENLEAARSQAILKLRELMEGPKKPSYWVEGRQYKWEEYQRFLVQSIRDMNSLIATMGGGSVHEESGIVLI